MRKLLRCVVLISGAVGSVAVWPAHAGHELKMQGIEVVRHRNTYLRYKTTLHAGLGKLRSDGHGQLAGLLGTQVKRAMGHEPISVMQLRTAAVDATEAIKVAGLRSLTQLSPIIEQIEKRHAAGLKRPGERMLLKKIERIMAARQTVEFVEHGNPQRAEEVKLSAAKAVRVESDFKMIKPMVTVQRVQHGQMTQEGKVLLREPVKGKDVELSETTTDVKKTLRCELLEDRRMAHEEVVKMRYALGVPAEEMAQAEVALNDTLADVSSHEWLAILSQLEAYQIENDPLHDSCAREGEGDLRIADPSGRGVHYFKAFNIPSEMRLYSAKQSQPFSPWHTYQFVRRRKAADPLEILAFDGEKGARVQIYPFVNMDALKSDSRFERKSSALFNAEPTWTGKVFGAEWVLGKRDVVPTEGIAPPTMFEEQPPQFEAWFPWQEHKALQAVISTLYRDWD